MTGSQARTVPSTKESGVLRVLSLETSSSETEHLKANMSEGGIECEMVKVQTRAGYITALADGGLDLILSGYPIPSFDDISALQLAQETCPGVPFIVVSGRAGEEIAIETVKSGATDYVLKHRLERLVPAVRRAIRDSEERRERVHADEALRISEQQFRTLVEQIPVATYIQQTIEPERIGARPTVYASPQIEAISGYPPQAFVEDPELWIKLLHPEDRERVLAADRHTDESGEPFRVEYRQITRDGRVVWIRDEAVLVRSEEGYPRFWQGVMYDITDRKRAEEELKESEERFSAIFEQATVGIAQVDLDGGWLRVNDKLCEIIGYSREEIMRLDFRDILAPEDLARDLERRAQMLRGEYRNYSEEKCIRHKDGSLRWVYLTVTLIYSSGEPESFVGVIQDITNRKLVENELSESEERFRNTFEQVAVGMAHTAPDGSWLRVNQRLCDILGYTREELLQKTFQTITHPDDLEVDLAQSRRLLAGAIPNYSMEKRYIKKDGSIVWIDLTVSLVRGATGEPDYFITAVEDITERKRAEERLRRSFSVLLSLRQASQLLNSTLSSEEIVSRLLEIMRSVSNLRAAVISLADEQGEPRIWHSAGLDALWERARFEVEPLAARQAALAGEEHRLFRLRRPGSDGEYLMGLCMPLGVKNQVFGVLEAYGSESLADNEIGEILSSLSSQAASALENARLYEEVEQNERALQELLGKLLGAQEEERRRVAYEVHDGLAQVAVAAHQHLQAFARRYASSVEGGQEDLERILKLVRATVSDSRRIIANLRPTTLDDLGLAATVSLEVDNLRKDGYRVDYTEDLGGVRLPGAVEIALFRIIQEALTNVRKHAETRDVRVSLERRGSEVDLEVEDYGRGLDPALAFNSSGPGERVGLAGMRERVSILDGTFAINSRPGAGTSIVVTVPLERLP